MRYPGQFIINSNTEKLCSRHFFYDLATDFDFWMSRDDGLYGGKDVPELVRKLPNEWTEGEKGPVKTLKAIHDEILLVGKGSAGHLGDRKMADVIKASRIPSGHSDPSFKRMAGLVIR